MAERRTRKSSSDDERGRFVWPSAKEGKVALTPAQLAMLLDHAC